jgi:tyrosyl-tRNA synthetase
MSFTEFTYQLIQGYDFYHLYKNNNCLLQMGGSDQWGNITTGTELVRRMGGENAKAFALTTPLITKADGSKFGKSEGGNVWLDADKTSVYKFYQFWVNATDADAEKYIKIFTFLDRETIDALIEEHKSAPHLRVLQKKLAEEITIFVHGKDALEDASKKSTFVFSNFTIEELKVQGEDFFLDIFGDFRREVDFSNCDIENGFDIVLVLSDLSGIFPSRAEARRALNNNAVSLNRKKITVDYLLTKNDLIFDKYLLIHFGKKNVFVITANNA